jgi:hypothetical protein
MGLRYIDGVPVVFGGVPAGMTDLAPKQEPPPEPMWKLMAKENFGLGDGVDATAGQELLLPRSHAQRVIRLGYAERIVDADEQRIAEAWQRAEEALAVEAAVARAAGRAHVPEPEGERLCRMLSPICLGNGLDATPGDEVVVSETRARELVALGAAEVVPDATPARLKRATRPPAPALPQPRRLRVRARHGFCVEAGHDCQPGELLELERDRALRLIAAEMVEPWPDPEPRPESEPPPAEPVKPRARGDR